MKIIFMGTPEFAISSLEKLINSHHTVVAVVTGPDKQTGRGQKVLPTPVKKFAQRFDIPVLTPLILKDAQFITELKRFDADIYAVVAFRVLPVSVFSIPPKGTINLHGSLLPKYRGAAPINWAIINGENETGVTTFFIDKKVDTGEILLKRNISIQPDETAGELHDRMCKIGAELLLETIDLVELNKISGSAQSGEVTLAPKITRDMCKIDWKKSAIAIKNLVRGLAPHPGAFTFYKGNQYKLCCVEVEQETFEANAVPGQIIGVDLKGKVFVATGNGVISITELQPQSKRKMSTAEYLRGYRIDIGEVLGG